MPATTADAPDFDYDVVIVENHGETALRYKWRNRWHILEPGCRVIKPAVAAHRWFGDWNLRDHPTDRGQRQRSAERRRVLRLHGVLMGEDPAGKLPPVVVRHPETNEELPTIVADPNATTFGDDKIARQDPAQILAQAGQLKSMLQTIASVAQEQGVDLSSILQETPDAPAPSGPPPSALPADEIAAVADDDDLPPVGRDGRAPSNPRQAPVKGKPKS